MVKCRDVMDARVPRGVWCLVATISLIFATSATAQAVPGPHAAFQRADNFHVPVPKDIRYPGTIQLNVNLADRAQGILRVHERIPVHAGQVTLLYPEWIPGEHAPAGHVRQLVGLRISAAGRRLMWHRDEYNVYAFRVRVPMDVTAINVAFEFVFGPGQSFGSVVADGNMAELDWNKVSLYPAGYYSRDILFAPSVTMPTNWKFGTALRGATRSARDADKSATWSFAPTAYNTLVDSPLYAGRYFERLDLTPKGSPASVHLDAMADAPRDLRVTSAETGILRNLVVQAYRMFGSYHYSHYDFLVALSDKLTSPGLEHHQSSEEGPGATFFTRWKHNVLLHILLPHEYTHSWDGKFRRPADLWTPNFNVPMGDSMLWMYEGGTEYLSTVLAARSGMWTARQFRQRLAIAAANATVASPGLAWRTVEDTTFSPVIDTTGSAPYSSWYLPEAYYFDAGLMWLAVDCKIRSLTHDRESLDTFSRSFFGGDSGLSATKLYTFHNVVHSLNRVVPMNWAAFLQQYLGTWHPPFNRALHAAGWKLEFTATPSAFEKNLQRGTGYVRLFNPSFAYSIGLAVSGDGRIRGVRWSGPAFLAGVPAGGKVVSVDGEVYSTKALSDAVELSRRERQPIRLLVRRLGAVHGYRVAYYGGLRYPHLVRIPGTVDYLDQIIQAR
ncbi:MAG TPA: peptidase M61 [Rhodanobacteraceae bacterium]